MNSKIEIRPLKRGEEDLWVSIGVCEEKKELQKKELSEYLLENPTLGPDNYLLAFNEGRFVGKLRGIPNSTGYVAMRIYIAMISRRLDIAAALFSHVEHYGPLQALSWQKEDDNDWRDLLNEFGFSVYDERAYFQRKIIKYVSPYNKELHYKSLADAGESVFLDIYRKTYDGNLNRNLNTNNSDTDFRENIDLAGKLFDANHWYIAYDRKNSSAVGIILPQRFHDNPNEGTLFYIGIVPEFRNKGLGKILHAKGLELLSMQGATNYLGSTDILNKPMMKIFELNGCQQMGIRATHRRNS